MQTGNHHPCGRAPAPVVVRDDFVRILDTDATGRIFYGAAVAWLGQAAEDLLLPLGIGRVGDPPMAAPVRHLEVFYDGPLCLYDRYEHRAWISHVGTSSFAISHTVSVEGEVRLRATTTSVHVSGEGKPAPLPATVRQALLGGAGHGASPARISPIRSRSTRLRIFPVGLRGMASMASRRSGCLMRASPARVRCWSMSVRVGRG